jgi:hypothetical protein
LDRGADDVARDAGKDVLFLSCGCINLQNGGTTYGSIRWAKSNIPELNRSDDFRLVDFSFRWIQIGGPY